MIINKNTSKNNKMEYNNTRRKENRALGLNFVSKEIF